MSNVESDILKGPLDKKEWMGLALQKAEDSLRKAEVPVGCLFIYENEVIASGNNTVNETRNATRHAEINCIDKVLEYCKERQLDYHEVFKKIDVVVTVEPCIMCAAALHQLRIRSIVYGCPNDRFGGCMSVFEVPAISDAVIDITSNVRAEEAMILLKNFYKGTNPNAPECKVKKKKPFPTPAVPTENKEGEEANKEDAQKKDNEKDSSGEVSMKSEEGTIKNEIVMKSEEGTIKDEIVMKSEEGAMKNDIVMKSEEGAMKNEIVMKSAEKADMKNEEEMTKSKEDAVKIEENVAMKNEENVKKSEEAICEKDKPSETQLIEDQKICDKQLQSTS